MPINMSVLEESGLKLTSDLERDHYPAAAASGPSPHTQDDEDDDNDVFMCSAPVYMLFTPVFMY